jgi:serine/threonine-protein kinase HipA
MSRRSRHPQLQVYLNADLVGVWLKEASGAIVFRYDPSWVAREDAVPISLSLPLREDAFKGEPVQAVFENLLPDSEALRRRVAERIGAEGTDAYSLLSRIGRDCVGALQFLPQGEKAGASRRIEGELLDESALEALLKKLGRIPLGLDEEGDFRISVAGVQEKTALLYHEGHWLKPQGTTPTSHILKTQIGKLPNGLDLSNSIENDFYCLRLLAAFGLPVAEAEVQEFGKTKVLIVKRFDRKGNANPLRIPQEDCCQALSVPPCGQIPESRRSGNGRDSRPAERQRSSAR